MRVIQPIRLRQERGAVVPIVVLCLVALFGMVVLTVDVGGLLAKRRSMVNASDAAALAAAQSFAFQIEANCGTNEGGAQAKADTFAKDNVTAAARLSSTNGWQTDCANQTVKVGYTTQQQLFFAPVLGFPSSGTVSSTATAKWGPPQGGSAMPVELDPLTTNQCVYPGGDPTQPVGPAKVCDQGYWFNNGDLTGSGWGLMNLNTWGVDVAASCDNSGGANDLSGWIDQSNPLLVKLKTIPTYVCTTDGGKTPDWMDSMSYWANVYQDWVAAGSPLNDPAHPVPPSFLFPINDPSQMVFGPPTSTQKYAIVNFAPMQVVNIFDVGKDTDAAIGGQYSCNAGYTFPSSGSTLDLSTASLTALPPSNCSGTLRTSIQNVKVVPATGGKAYSSPSDYTVTTDPVTNHTILTWKKSGPTAVKVSFDYRTGGACPGHSPDPNAFCLQLAWAGPQLIGIDPGDGYGPAMAVELIK